MGLLSASASADEPTAEPVEPKPTTKSILRTAIENKLKIFVAAFKISGMSEPPSKLEVETEQTLNQRTVFAFTDQSFRDHDLEIIALIDSRNRAQLLRFVSRHIVNGQIDLTEFDGKKTVQSIDGQSLTIERKDGEIWVGQAKVLEANIKCSDGIIHVISGVIAESSEPESSESVSSESATIDSESNEQQSK